MPTFKSETTHPSATGITAQEESARTVAMSGASKKIVLFAPAGIIGSLSTNLRKSAKDCKSPKAPTTLGPRLSWTAAQIFRSARSRKAMLIMSTTSSRKLCPSIMAAGKPYFDQSALQSTMRARSPKFGFLAQGRKFGHHRRRPRDGVRLIIVLDQRGNRLIRERRKPVQPCMRH